MASRSTKQLRYAPNAKPVVASAPKPRPAMAHAVRSVVAKAEPKMAMTVKPIVNTVMNKRRPMPLATGTDRNGNRLGPRPRVGEADPATRRAALDAALKPGPAVKSSAPKPPPAQAYEGGGMGNKTRRKVIDDTVDRMSR